jgi:hypothetical protein
MDPYLEGSLWLSVHTNLCSEFVRLLTPKLRPRYLALAPRHFVMSTPESVVVESTGLFPDVSVVRSQSEISRAETAALTSAPLRLATVVPEAVPHVEVEIRDRETRRLVTAIELLSPYNKRGDGRDEYLVKRGRILRSSAHLLEIDLLRTGQRLPMREPLPRSPYFIFLSRAPERPVTEVWPVALDARLPVVPVPLLAGDPDVLLDLQLAFTNVYDQCGYDLAADYSQPPEVPLSREEAAWAAERLRGLPAR